MEAYKEFVFHEDCPKTKLFPEMVDLIHKCKEKKYFLAVVSSDLSTTLLPEIEEFG
jgi:phosphoglycolate phosphatase-like HAD superfamily hydrolase